jgi:hypothetical protein
MKICRHCGKRKKSGEFRRNSRMKDGLSSWCSDCHREATRRWRAENREAYNESRRVVKAYVWDPESGRSKPNPSPRPKSKVA